MCKMCINCLYVFILVQPLRNHLLHSFSLQSRNVYHFSFSSPHVTPCVAFWLMACYEVMHCICVVYSTYCTLLYANHPSILKINGTIEKIKFFFNEIEISDIESEINNLNSKKANTFNCVPSKIIKEYRDVCKLPLFNIINNGIKDSMFDDGLKFADMTQVYKKGDVTDTKLSSCQCASCSF